MESCAKWKESWIRSSSNNNSIISNGKVAAITEYLLIPGALIRLSLILKTTLKGKYLLVFLFLWLKKQKFWEVEWLVQVYKTIKWIFFGH